MFTVIRETLDKDNKSVFFEHSNHENFNVAQKICKEETSKFKAHSPAAAQSGRVMFYVVENDTVKKSDEKGKFLTHTLRKDFPPIDKNWLYGIRKKKRLSQKEMDDIKMYHRYRNQPTNEDNKIGPVNLRTTIISEDPFRTHPASSLSKRPAGDGPGGVFGSNKQKVAPTNTSETTKKRVKENGPGGTYGVNKQKATMSESIGGAIAIGTGLAALGLIGSKISRENSYYVADAKHLKKLHPVGTVFNNYQYDSRDKPGKVKIIKWHGNTASVDLQHENGKIIRGESAYALPGVSEKSKYFDGNDNLKNDLYRNGKLIPFKDRPY